MATYFRGWRRKMGCMTLAMACAFMVLWVRSFASTNDQITVWAKHSLYSHNGWVSWNINYVDPSMPFVMQSPTTPVTKSRWEFYGVVVSDTVVFGNQGVKQYWVIYWYFITPLTLFSAWLLLGKQSQRTSNSGL